MILTVTPNPALDRTLPIDSLERGGVLRAGVPSVEPSGKGVNVAVALARQGITTRALLPLGGHTGLRLQDELARTSVHTVVQAITGETRTNTSLREPGGVVTKVNEPGPVLSRTEAEDLLALVAGHAQDATWVASCGGLPPGASADFHAGVVARAHAAGARCAVDSSGPALRAALTACPDLVKPNVHELAELTGHELRTFGDVRRACTEVRDSGAVAVLVSLGRDGALLASPDAGAGIFGTAAPTGVVSTVGAGDALLAGYLAAVAAPDVEAQSAASHLRTALSWAAAAVQSATTFFVLDDQPAQVVIGPPPEDDERLTEPASPAH